MAYEQGCKRRDRSMQQGLIRSSDISVQDHQTKVNLNEKRVRYREQGKRSC